MLLPSLHPSLPPSPRPEERAGGGWQPRPGGLGGAERCGAVRAPSPPAGAAGGGGECVRGAAAPPLKKSRGSPLELGGNPPAGIGMLGAVQSPPAGRDPRSCALLPIGFWFKGWGESDGGGSGRWLGGRSRSAPAASPERGGPGRAEPRHPPGERGEGQEAAGGMSAKGQCRARFGEPDGRCRGRADRGGRRSKSKVKFPPESCSQA